MASISNKQKQNFNEISPLRLSSAGSIQPQRENFDRFSSNRSNIWNSNHNLRPNAISFGQTGMASNMQVDNSYGAVAKSAKNYAGQNHHNYSNNGQTTQGNFGSSTSSPQMVDFDFNPFANKIDFGQSDFGSGMGLNNSSNPLTKSLNNNGGFNSIGSAFDLLFKTLNLIDSLLSSNKPSNGMSEGGDLDKKPTHASPESSKPIYNDQGENGVEKSNSKEIDHKPAIKDDKTISKDNDKSISKDKESSVDKKLIKDNEKLKETNREPIKENSSKATSPDNVTNTEPVKPTSGGKIMQSTADLKKQGFVLEGGDPGAGGGKFVFDARKEKVKTPNGGGDRHEMKLDKSLRTATDKTQENFSARITPSLSKGSKAIVLQLHPSYKGASAALYVADTNEKGKVNGTANDGQFEVYLKVKEKDGSKKTFNFGTIEKGQSIDVNYSNDRGKLQVSAMGKKSDVYDVQRSDADYLKFGSYLQAKDAVTNKRAERGEEEAFYKKRNINEARVMFENIQYDRKVL